MALILFLNTEENGWRKMKIFIQFVTSLRVSLHPTTPKLEVKAYLRAMETPTLGSLFVAPKSISPAIVKKNLCQNPCWIRAAVLPDVSNRAFTNVCGKNACWAPMVRPVSLIDKLCLTSAAMAVLVRGFTSW